ncbi:MAG: zinc metallopeptidase [Bacteroidota bacterium]
MYLIIIIGTMIASWAVSARLKSKFRKYSQIPIGSGLSGKEIAERMLSENGIYDVQVMSVPGKLTDHYNPRNRTVNLSPEVYAGRSAAAAAVAAHECGHAVQHARSYSMLEFRSTLVPIQNVSARVLNAIFIGLMFGSILLPGLIPFDLALLIIIGCYFIFTLFAFVTLPVEFDASKRALAWIQDRGVVNPQEYDMAKDALKWAAMTYVVAALGSLVQLLYWVMIFLGRSSD